MSETVHIGCSVFCCVLPNLPSNMVLGIDWLHTINPLIDWSTHSLSIGCIGKIIYILGTKGLHCIYIGNNLPPIYIVYSIKASVSAEH